MRRIKNDYISHTQGRWYIIPQVTTTTHYATLRYTVGGFFLQAGIGKHLAPKKGLSFSSSGGKKMAKRGIQERDGGGLRLRLRLGLGRLEFFRWFGFGIHHQCNYRHYLI